MAKEYYVLRTCNEDLTSRGGFKWPKRGPVTCPDWNPEPVCGYGLHGLLNGEGNASHLRSDGKGLIVKITRFVDLVGKVKFKSGKVVFCGTLREAATKLVSLCPGHIVHYATVAAGDNGAATAGYRGTATAGDNGTATAGDNGTATAGYRGTATAGEYGTATAGDRGTIQIKYYDGSRYRVVTGYIGENGLKPNTAYKLDDKHNFTEVK